MSERADAAVGAAFFSQKLFLPFTIGYLSPLLLSC